MGKLFYRIGLVMILVGVIILAILWYQNCEEEKDPENGIFVLQEDPGKRSVSYGAESIIY